MICIRLNLENKSCTNIKKQWLVNSNGTIKQTIIYNNSANQVLTVIYKVKQTPYKYTNITQLRFRYKQYISLRDVHKLRHHFCSTFSYFRSGNERVAMETILPCYIYEMYGIWKTVFVGFDPGFFRFEFLLRVRICRSCLLANLKGLSFDYVSWILHYLLLRRFGYIWLRIRRCERTFRICRSLRFRVVLVKYFVI